MEIDHDTLTVRVDWHQYAPDQVETWSDPCDRGGVRARFPLRRVRSGGE